MVEKAGGKSGDWKREDCMAQDSPRAPLLPVADALARILETAREPLGPRRRRPARRAGTAGSRRTLRAKRTQPPCAVSAMDGYAVRAADIANVPARLQVVGVSAAGRGFAGPVGPGQAARIFTGAPVPAGADTILIQEDAKAEDGHVTALASEPLGRYVRRAGLDFAAGDVLAEGWPPHGPGRTRAGRRHEPREPAGGAPAARRHPCDRRRTRLPGRRARPRPDRRIQQFRRRRLCAAGRRGRSRPWHRGRRFPRARSRHSPRDAMRRPTSS